MSFAMVFPGQGSQFPGMLQALAARHACVRSCFAEASDVLGYDLWQVVSDGPAERLASTECTQPAMLAADVACFHAWRAAGGNEPTWVAGHSLGEFAALVCAGALAYAPAVALVRHRAELMQLAMGEAQGAMAAILGLADTDVEAACRDAAQGQVVEAVNYNAPGQVVIAGHAAAVQRALQGARERGARRTLSLPISVPAHCRLMQPAAGAFAIRLAAVQVSRPRIGYISAVDAQLHDDPAEIRALLGRQLAVPVRWSQTVTELEARLTARSAGSAGTQAAGGSAGAARAALLLECGPGKVLTGLSRRIASAAECRSIEDPDTLEQAVAISRLACEAGVLGSGVAAGADA